jgi:hypothetical protein
MKKIIYTLLIMFISLQGFSQDTAKLNVETEAGLDVTSANVYRGVRFGNGASVIGYASAKISNFKVGVSSYHTLAAKSGYDNGFSMWKDEFTELRGEYETEKTKFTLAMTTRGTYYVPGGREEDNTAIYSNNLFRLPTIYSELRLKLFNGIYGQAGFVTGASGLNFYGNGTAYNPGFTNLGLIAKYDAIDGKVPVELGFLYNPKAKDNMTAGGVSKNTLLFYGKITLF